MEAWSSLGGLFGRERRGAAKIGIWAPNLGITFLIGGAEAHNIAPNNIKLGLLFSFAAKATDVSRDNLAPRNRYIFAKTLNPAGYPQKLAYKNRYVRVRRSRWWWKSVLLYYQGCTFSRERPIRMVHVPFISHCRIKCVHDQTAAASNNTRHLHTAVETLLIVE